MPPQIVSTWPFAERANRAAWPALAVGGDPLDAVVEACRAAELDPEVNSVGWGGLPDASGRMTLDGCVMLSPAKCGSVCVLRTHLHPVRVARLVMERTQHVMLAGEAADEFANAHGEPERELLAPSAREAWEKWRATEDRRTSGHDTIGTIAISADGRMAGACSTSGTAYKVPGRVGDSPIIGHGLYVDPKVGGATATGAGELIMGVCGSFLVVELMRGGATPAEAARAVIERVANSYDLKPHHEVAFIAVAASGAWSSASLRPGFNAAVHDAQGGRLVPAEFVLLQA